MGKKEMSNLSTVTKRTLHLPVEMLVLFKKSLLVSQNDLEPLRICRTLPLQVARSLVHRHPSSVWRPLCQEAALLGDLSLSTAFPAATLGPWASVDSISKCRGLQMLSIPTVPLVDQTTML